MSQEVAPNSENTKVNKTAVLHQRPTFGRKGLAAAVHKRHQKTKKSGYICGPAIKRLGFRAGTKRMSPLVEEAVRQQMKKDISDLVRIAIILMAYFRKKTVTARHVKCAIETVNNPKRIYG